MAWTYDRASGQFIEVADWMAEGNPVQWGTPRPATPSSGTTSSKAPATGGTAQPTATGTVTPGYNARQAQSDAALARIEQVGTGQNVPVTAATRANQVSTQSDMSASAQAQQQAGLRRATAASGGSLYDPSHSAAEREMDANRQGQNQRSVNAIDTNAAQQNFDAQFAANRLLVWDGSPYARAGGEGRYGNTSAPASGGAGAGSNGYNVTMGQEFAEGDPRRGGRVSGSGLGLNPNNLAGLGAYNGQVSAASPAPLLPGTVGQAPTGRVSSTDTSSVAGIRQKGQDDLSANIEWEAKQLGQYGYSKYQQFRGWGYSPSDALESAKRYA